MRGKLSLPTGIVALRELGGYFTFPGDHGDQYVLINKKDFDKLVAVPQEIQLELPDANLKSKSEPVAEDTSSDDQELGRINQDISEYQLKQDEITEFDHLDDKEFYDEDINNAFAKEESNDEKSPNPRYSPLNENNDVDQNNMQTLTSVPPRPPAVPPSSTTQVHFEPIRGDLPPELQP